MDATGDPLGDPEVRRCVATQWFRYAMGRDELAGDRAWTEPLKQGLEQGGDVRQFLEALAGSPLFTLLPAVSKGTP